MKKIKKSLLKLCKALFHILLIFQVVFGNSLIIFAQELSPSPTLTEIVEPTATPRSAETVTPDPTTEPTTTPVALPTESAAPTPTEAITPSIEATTSSTINPETTPSASINPTPMESPQSNQNTNIEPSNKTNNNQSPNNQSLNIISVSESLNNFLKESTASALTNIESKIRLPFNGSYPISQGFGVIPDDPYLKKIYHDFGIVGHDGIDYEMPEGTEILAADQGVVISAGPGIYGITITIFHVWGITYYGHLSKVNVQPGQLIKTGELIGYSGQTGETTGPHLHFGVKPINTNVNNGYHGMVDPQFYLDTFRQKDVLAATTAKGKKITVFKATENPEFELNIKPSNLKFALKDFVNNEISGRKKTLKKNNKDFVRIESINNFRPGKYSLEISNDQGQTEEQEFIWGILAINTNKSIYFPNDTANLAMAVLDEKGYMVCDAKLELIIQNQKLKINDILSTENGKIKINDECNIHDFTLRPDYEANYQVKEAGRYQMTLTAFTNNGSYEISDFFDVKNNINFDVERLTATRIYPPKEYSVYFNIKANQDFEGVIEESVPKDFEIKPVDEALPFSSINSQNNGKMITWNIDIKKGEVIRLGYRYDAPDVSPYLYLLGPLVFKDKNGNSVFEEVRRWQIASDAPITPTPVFISGAEAGIVTVGSSATNLVPVWNTVNGTPTADTTTFRNGLRSYRFNPSATTTYLSRTITSQRVVGRMAIRFATLPASGTIVLMQLTNTNGNMIIQYSATGTKLQAKAGAATAVDGPTITTGTWYLIDFDANTSGGTATLDWRVNKTALTQASNSQTAANMTAFIVGLATSTTADLYIDDIMLSFTGGDYPLGDGKILGFSPDGSGSHSFTAGDFQDNTSTNITTPSGTVHTFIDEVPITSSSDYIKQVVNRTTGYIRFDFQTSSVTQDARGVAIYSSQMASGTTTNNATFRLDDGGSLSDIYPSSDISQSSLIYNADFFPTPPSGGTWTQTKINALAARWGYSGDASPNPYLQGVLMEVEYPVFSVSGTCKQVNQSSNCSDSETVRVAINGTLDTATGTTSGGAWSITLASTDPNPGDVVTVYISGVTDNKEAVAVTKWPSTPDLQNVILYENNLVIGSTGASVTISDTDLGQYDYSASGNNEDIFHDYNGSNSFSACAISGCSTVNLNIISGNTYQPKSGGGDSISTYDVQIDGTLDLTGTSTNTFTLTGSWTKNGTFTSGSNSTVNFNGADESNQTITGSNTFYNFSASTAGNSNNRTITFTAGTTQTITGTWTITGYPNKIITLQSSTTSAWTVNPTSASVTYALISYSTNSGNSFCATYSINGGNNSGFRISTSNLCVATAYSFQRKTWHDGTRYWRAYHDTANSRIRFDYSATGSSWSENTSAQIPVNTNDFSIEANSNNAFIVYTNGYDIEARSASSYPGTSFSWGTATVVYNGTSTSDYYYYPTITKDSNNKLWVSSSQSGTGTITNLQPENESSQENTWEIDRIYWNPDGEHDNIIYTGAWGGCVWSGSRWALPSSIPAGATITSATASFYSQGNDPDTQYLRIWATDSSNAGSASSASDRPSIDPTYGGNTTVYPNNLNTGIRWPGSGNLTSSDWPSSGNWATTPDIKSLIQYLVDTYNGLASGNHIVLWLADPTCNGYHEQTWLDRQAGLTNSPKLNITYTLNNIKAIQSSNANDISAWNTATTLDSSSNTNKYSVIVPRTSGSVFAVWMDGTAIESKNYNGTSWDASPTAVATGVSGLTTTISALSDSSGNIHLTYINNSNQTIYQRYTSSWQTAVTLDSNSGNAYPTITLNTSNSDLYAFWIRGDDIYYKKGASPYASGNWDASATAWQTSGTNTFVTSNVSGSNNIFALWHDDTAIAWAKINFNTAPNSPSSLAQKTTSDVIIATGGWHNTTSIKFTASASDTDNPDTLYLCVEKDDINTAFSNNEDLCGTGVAYSGSPVTVTVTISGISDATSYHWQARIKDSANEYSSWVSYGGNSDTTPGADRDFGIDTTAPTGGTVYDGTSIGVDSAFNDGSLSSLSANWSGFNANVSGLASYDYSIGTSQGATDVKNWTSNDTNTSVTVNNLTLQTSQMYYFNVRINDNAGNSSIVYSNGQLILPSLTFSLDTSSIIFNRLNQSNSYTDTKITTLTTSTNAYNGYVIRAYKTDLLRSTIYPSTTIADFSAGSYAEPSEWTAGNYGFGYTSSDTSIQGVAKFPASGSCLGTGNAPCYAPFSSTGPGDIVADHTATVTGSPISNEAFTITYKIAASNTQPAGPYTTTVVYTITTQY